MQAQEQIPPDPQLLQGPVGKKVDIRVPIKEPFFVEHMAAFDAHMRLLGYPKSITKYELTIRQYIQYGHKVFLTPLVQTGQEIEGMAQKLEAMFKEGAPKDSADALKLLADSQVAIIKYLRGN